MSKMVYYKGGSLTYIIHYIGTGYSLFHVITKVSDEKGIQTLNEYSRLPIQQ